MINNKKTINKIIYLLMTIFICFNTVAIGSKEDKNIHNNIIIEEVNVGKLTKKEAIKKLEENYELKAININHENKKWTIKPKDIDLDFHIEEKVEEAFNYTRSEKILENIKRKINLDRNKTHNIKLKATYDEIKLNKIIQNICKEININSVDATFKIETSGEMKITKSKEGKKVDSSRVKEEIYNMINKKKIKDVNLSIITLYPKISSEQVESINSVLGQFSTSFNNNTSRGSNIHVAGESSSDVLLMPGETFSYNETTGARNWVNGYKSAPVIIGGKIVNGEGGGVCQVSTTIYNAALLSGMRIDEVHNHTIPSRYAQRGRDATVSYGYRDLKFTNTFSHPIYIKNTVGNGAITSKIYGCKLDREKIVLKIEEQYTKDKITVQTYRIYLDEENNIMRKELVNTSIYKYPK